VSCATTRALRRDFAGVRVPDPRAPTLPDLHELIRSLHPRAVFYAVHGTVAGLRRSNSSSTTARTAGDEEAGPRERHDPPCRVREELQDRFFNPHRTGCAMENFATPEHMPPERSATSPGTSEFAELDLDAPRLPFDSATPSEGGLRHYRRRQDGHPASRKEHRWSRTSPRRNVHFPPGARATTTWTAFTSQHIESWRMRTRDGRQGGSSQGEVGRYSSLAPDCMERDVFWPVMPARQQSPTTREPMKNWWVFMFY